MAQSLAHRAGGAASAAEVQQWVRDVVAASATNLEKEELQKKLEEAEEALARVEQAVAAANEPSGKDARDWSAVADAAEAKLAQAAALEAAARDVRNASEGSLERQIVDVRLENEQLRGTLANARRRLESFGRGTERPACWATADGRPEYIFDVALSAGGIIITNRALPHRREQQARLPTGSIQFGRSLDIAEFRRQTRPLFDWGESRGCRFFVLAVDRTGAGQKEIFKQRMRVMEEHFYKFLSN